MFEHIKSIILDPTVLNDTFSTINKSEINKIPWKFRDPIFTLSIKQLSINLLIYLLLYKCITLFKSIDLTTF